MGESGMTDNEIMNVFEQCGALMEGHFLLSSGLHSNRYVQCARVFEHPRAAERLCGELTQKISDVPVDIVLGPAVGAITMAYEMSRQTGVPNVFAEREGGELRLRRGFSIPEGARVLLVEDVVTTGGSVKELFPIVKAAGATVTGVACLVDRSGGTAEFDVPFSSVLQVDVETFEPENCPLCEAGQPLEEPGSRRLR